MAPGLASVPFWEGFGFGPVILDGGLATELERRGADLRDPLWSAKLLLEDPVLIRQVHEAYVAAGADVATTATYQLSLEGFAQRGLDRQQTVEVVRLSVRLAREAGAKCVAASVGPYGAFLADGVTLTSITAHETTDDFSLGDIDGGHGADFLGNAGPCPPGNAPTDPCIPFPSQTQDGIDNLDQFTQEFRIASQATPQLFWQAGAFYFDSEFGVTTTPFFVPPTSVFHANEAWAVFGHLSYDVTDDWTLTGGLRYTDDEKDLHAANAPAGPITPVSVDDDQVSGDFSAMYTVNDNVNLYGRVATGFQIQPPW